MTADGPKHFVRCFLCQNEFQYGPNRYAGRPVKAWGIQICELCERMNDDGLVTEQHPRLIAHLRQAGVAFQPNARGWLDIPGN
jgi:hypothetical protein